MKFNRYLGHFQVYLPIRWRFFNGPFRSLFTRSTITGPMPWGVFTTATTIWSPRIGMFVVSCQKNLCKPLTFKLKQLTNTRPTRPIPIPIVPFAVSIPKPVPFPLPLDPFSRFLPLRHLRLTVVIILFARGTDVLRPIPDFQYPVSVVPLQLHTFRRRS